MTHSTHALEVRRDNLLWLARWVSGLWMTAWLPTAFGARCPWQDVFDELGRLNPGWPVVSYE
jgi:hypothetical protein